MAYLADQGVAVHNLEIVGAEPLSVEPDRAHDRGKIAGFTSVNQIVITKDELLVAHQYAARAHELLAAMPQETATRTPPAAWRMRALVGSPRTNEKDRSRVCNRSGSPNSGDASICC